MYSSGLGASRLAVVHHIQVEVVEVIVGEVEIEFAKTIRLIQPSYTFCLFP